MRVVSLFDGMSCGYEALKRAGITPTLYYAAEIDKYAMQIAKKNHPWIIHMGDVTKWREWDVDWSKIDLLIGGSPCQGFSFAGKQLAFDDPRSKLFFVYVDILNHIKSLNPNVKFLLENVKMKNEFLAVISEQLGVQPVFINSSLVSAQNRQRYYWANWEFRQPEDKGILLKDILEESGIGVIKNHEELQERNEKAMCLDANYHKGVDNHGQRTMIKGGAIRGRCLVDGVRQDHKGLVAGRTTQVLEVRDDEKTNALTTVQKDSVVVKIRDKSKCVRSSGRDSVDRHEWDSGDDLHYRKLTPLECERLQTLPDGYTEGVSNTQRYRMIGNGWTVDVIAHILRSLPKC